MMRAFIAALGRIHWRKFPRFVAYGISTVVVLTPLLFLEGIVWLCEKIANACDWAMEDRAWARFLLTMGMRLQQWYEKDALS